ncbi:MAG: hypothetical protein MUF84_19320 [Anaerolineae bacterium]|nr:hypothetical protein [Anaerolineae bacterium]
MKNIASSGQPDAGGRSGGADTLAGGFRRIGANLGGACRFYVLLLRRWGSIAARQHSVFIKKGILMNHAKVWSIVGLVVLSLVACGRGTATALPGPAPTPIPLPLSELGPYSAGKRSYVAEDPARGNREVPITVWYPAVRPEGATQTAFWVDRGWDPDPSGAPYPLLVSSTKVANIFAPYLISHGFAWVSVDGIDSYPQMRDEMYNQPMDILFALNEVATHPSEGLEGMIDADRAGAIGYSFDGYNTLAMSGARVDPDYYRAQCAAPDTTTTEVILSRLSAFSCDPAKDWDAFAARAGDSLTTSDDGLWQPMADPRIRAVMPMACEGWWLFGERGLAAVDRPTLMLVSTDDELYAENMLIYEHLGAPDKAFISFVGRDHMMIYDTDMVARMAHFAVAFFGVHLQGREDLRQYFSEQFISQYDDLAWGAAEGE